MIAKRICGLGVLLVPVGLVSVVLAGTPQGTAFSYQGQLKQDGLPLNGLVDLEFSLHADPAATTRIGADFRIDAVEVVKGLFEVQVDFGAEAFAGAARWLEVRVRTPHDPADAAPFVTLDPRQPVTATPYALQTRGIVVDDQGEVGIGTTEPDAPFHVLVDTTTAILAEANAGGAIAVEGRVFANSGGGAGVMGKIFTPSGRGVEGEARSQTGSPSGVSGIVHSPEGARAVSALSLADHGVSYAVFADARSPDGYAGYFEGGRNYFEGKVGVGTLTPDTQLHVRGDSGLLIEDASGHPVLAAHGQLGGKVGIGTTNPRAELSVVSDQALIEGPVMQSDDIVVESTDAVIGLYSDGSGTTGSAVSFKEIGQQGTLTDHWAIYRETNQAGSNLHFTYGPSSDYATNPSMMTITTAPSTRYLNVSASAFAHTANLKVSIGVETRSQMSRFENFNVSGAATADVSLPDGATVTGLTALMRDRNADDDLRVRLRRSSTTSENPPESVLAEISSSGDSDFQIGTDDTIDSPVVNNHTHMYQLRVFFPPSQEGVDFFMSFYSAQIEYTIQTPLP